MSLNFVFVDCGKLIIILYLIYICICNTHIYIYKFEYVMYEHICCANKIKVENMMNTSNLSTTTKYYETECEKSN